jgi:hypothetical protein
MTSVPLLASAAEAQIAREDDVVRNGRPTCSTYALMAESSFDWEAAYVADSRGATGFINIMSARHMAAYPDATAMSRNRKPPS